jgi:hypothetical protein
MAARYTKYPQGIDQKLPLPPTLKNDIVLTPNHESLHANSYKQPFALVVDSRHRNMELYPNANNYVIQIPRYKDVLSVEITGADIPHSGFNIDATCNKLYLVTTQDMYEKYQQGVRVNGQSYIEVVIPPGNYEAGDFASQIIDTSNNAVAYQCYYDYNGPVFYAYNTGVLAMALHLAVLTFNFAVVFNYKTLKYVIVSNGVFGVVNLDKDNYAASSASSGIGSPMYPADGYLGQNNGHYNPLPNCMWAVLGFDLKNYLPPLQNFYTYQQTLTDDTNTALIDGAFNTQDPLYVQISQGQKYDFPGLFGIAEVLLDAGEFVAYSLPNRANFTGEKYIILDIPELNYRESTSVINNQFFCRIILDTDLNSTSLAGYYNRSATDAFFPTTLASVNTVKSIKASDIGNSKCIKYFTPSLGVLSKLTVRWLKHNGTPYDFQGQDHTLGFEIQTINQSAAYYKA